MTKTVEKSRISRAFTDSHTERLCEINEMKQSLVRQIKEGRSSAQLMSSELRKSIQHDLKNIFRHVAENRSAASNLILRYRALRQKSAKTLKATLEIDRIGLAVMIEKTMLGLKQDRILARASSSSCRSGQRAKLRNSVKASSQAVTGSSEITAEVEKTSVEVAPSAPVMPSSPAQVAPSAQVKPSSPTQVAPSAQVKPSSPTQVAPSAPVKPSSPAQVAPSAQVKPSSPAQVAPSAQVKPSSPAQVGPSAQVKPSGPNK